MMTYTRKTYRLGTTAIAAVLSLSSTPLIAQEATSLDQPVADAPAEATAPVGAPAPAADPLAPAAEPEATATETTEAAAAPAEMKPAPKPVAKKPPVKTARTPENSVRSAVPQTPPKPAVEAGQDSDSSPLGSMKPAEVASIPDAKPAEKSELNEAVPLAGGAGAVVLALAGAGMAIRRRKRHEEEDAYEETMEVEPVGGDELPLEPEARWDPPIVEPRAPAAPAAASISDASDNFGASKFGRHVEAAYRGPTPENPSLSLRKRLKIAGELDRRERKSREALEAAKSEPAATRPISANPKAPERMAFSFAGSPFEQKWPEKQF